MDDYRHPPLYPGVGLAQAEYGAPPEHLISKYLYRYRERHTYTKRNRQTGSRSRWVLRLLCGAAPIVGQTSLSFPLMCSSGVEYDRWLIVASFRRDRRKQEPTDEVPFIRNWVSIVHVSLALPSMAAMAVQGRLKTLSGCSSLPPPRPIH